MYFLHPPAASNAISDRARAEPARKAERESIVMITPPLEVFPRKRVDWLVAIIELCVFVRSRNIPRMFWEHSTKSMCFRADVDLPELPH